MNRIKEKKIAFCIVFRRVCFVRFSHATKRRLCVFNNNNNNSAYKRFDFLIRHDDVPIHAVAAGR